MAATRPSWTTAKQTIELYSVNRKGERISLGFVQNLDPGDGRIVHDWFKDEVQLPLRNGLQMTEGLRDFRGGFQLP